MPPIYEFYCTSCELQLTRGWGGYHYVLLDDGRREVLPHPLEHLWAQQLTEEEIGSLIEQGRLGMVSFLICRQCVQVCELDLERDMRRCPRCGGRQLVDLLELVGQRCPACGRGRVQKRLIGIS